MNQNRQYTVGLLGGLGNQLFQFAFGLWLGKSGGHVGYDAAALRSGTRRLDLKGFVDHASLPQKKWLNLMPYPRGRFGIAGEAVRMLRGPRRVWFEEISGTPQTPEIAPSGWYYGYWQSAERVAETLPELRRAIPNIPEIRTATVGIHVRRGDYVGNPMLLSPSYYRTALNALLEQLQLDPASLKVTVYSDDPTWCAENLIFDIPVAFSPPRSTTEDFRSLMESEYLVLSRSTFSWWAAVLPERPGTHVVAPYPYSPYPNQTLDYPGWLRRDLG